MTQPCSDPATDTICAIATPPGTGGIGVIRISGPAVKKIARDVCGRIPKPRFATYTEFLDADGTAIDTGLALFFPAPHSFTGEDVLELQGHGGPVVLQMLMERMMLSGARAARPGEFSERAFLNDKLDLAQAEAIADLVTSGTAAAARAAQHSLQGVFSNRVHDLQQDLTGIRVFVEAAIDFPQEEIDFLADSDVLQRLQQARSRVRDVLAQARQGQLLRDGIVVAIVGRPNAGKSSLLNALSGQDSAIVTEFPGTTRDVLREWIDLDGIPLHVADTAGLRETRDHVEIEGVKRARAALASADLALLVIDATAGLDQWESLLEEMPDPARTLVVFNKTDLLGSADAKRIGPDFHERAKNRVAISAKTGAGLDELKTEIRRMLGVGEQTEGHFSARQRHIDALRRADAHLANGETRLLHDQAAELLAEELRLAQHALGEITGEMLPDDLLGAIFASFCIGK